MATVEHHLSPLPSAALPASISNGNGTGAARHDDAGMDAVDSRAVSPSAIDDMASIGPQTGDTRIVVIIFGEGQDDIVSVFAEVLGKPGRTCSRFAAIGQAEHGCVVGIAADSAKADVVSRDQSAVVAINAHCVELGMPPDLHLSAHCDYEFLYTKAPFFRRDLARFTSHTLGQMNCHRALMAKPRTYFISTTFPDVRAALPNLDILTVGADAVEIRVDLLKEPLADGSFSAIPSLRYVGEQVMLLRQRTELPLIFTTRCTRENGRFPMDQPELFYEYLRRAIQWGVEYIDVELWLPEGLRKRLYRQRGNSHIMSAFHDFSGTFKWPSPRAESVFLESCRHADLVKMIAIIRDDNENFELEYFRSRMRTEHPDSPPLSAVNMGEMGQFSRTLNRVFSPITHPLLPIIAAPGQMSAAEINAALALLGQLPKKTIYGISSPARRGATRQAPFYEKCLNELGLPHQFAVVERQPARPGGGLESWCNQRNFGGAYLDPPASHAELAGSSPVFQLRENGPGGAILTDAARAIGVVDTIFVRPHPSGSVSSASPSPPSPQLPALLSSLPTAPSTQSKRNSSNGDAWFRSHGSGSGSGSASVSGAGLPPNATLVLDNASWRGILSTLTRDMAPSAYLGQAAVVLASSLDDAASALFALRALSVGKVYTVGFKTPAALSRGLHIEPFNSLESLQKARMLGADGRDTNAPFVFVSALAAGKSNLVAMLVRLFASWGSADRRKVFLDLADSSLPRRPDPAVIAEQSGFAAYGIADVTAFTTVERLRLLVGQNVPYSFVRLASGRALY